MKESHNDFTCDRRFSCRGVAFFAECVAWGESCGTCIYTLSLNDRLAFLKIKKSRWEQYTCSPCGSSTATVDFVSLSLTGMGSKWAPAARLMPGVSIQETGTGASASSGSWNSVSETTFSNHMSNRLITALSFTLDEAEWIAIFQFFLSI